MSLGSILIYMEMHHGHSSRKGFTAHLGLCLTDEIETAERYAHGDQLTTVNIDLDGLTVLTLDAGYVADTDEAPGDADVASFGADVIVYEDADENAQRHTTWRICTPAALAAITHISTTDLED